MKKMEFEGRAKSSKHKLSVTCDKCKRRKTISGLTERRSRDKFREKGWRVPVVNDIEDLCPDCNHARVVSNNPPVHKKNKELLESAYDMFKKIQTGDLSAKELKDWIYSYEIHKGMLK